MMSEITPIVRSNAVQCNARLTVASSIYAGPSGASNWVAVTKEAGYPLGATDRFLLMPIRLLAIEHIPFRTVVSFGVGDGELERLLIQSTTIASSAERIGFVPVDISYPLLVRSLQNLQQLPNVYAPLAVNCDFESEREFLAEILRHRLEKPIVFTMLGGTIANLLGGELCFLEWLKDVMDSRDAVLLDIPTAGRAWRASEEPRMQIASYSETFRRFLALAIARNGCLDTEPTEDSIKEIVHGFEDIVSLIHQTNTQIGFEQISVVERSNGQPVLQFRRYRFYSLVQAIRNIGMLVPFASLSPRSENDTFGMGVILVQKPTGSTGQ